MTRTSLSLAALVAALALPATAAYAAPVDVPIPLTHDLVVNYDVGGASFDSASTPADPDYPMAFATQTAIDNAGGGCGDPSTERGLPDDGFFGATAVHPAVQLDTQNANTGNNGKQMTGDGETFTVDVPDGAYSDLHVFAASGHVQTRLEVKFLFTDGSSLVRSRFAPMWHSGGLGSYDLTDEMDWMYPDASSCIDWNQVDIFGLPMVGDATKTVDSIQFTRRDPNADNGRLNLFGAVLVPAHELTVAKAGNGAGIVTSDPGGVDCGADCSERYAEGGVVALTAKANEGSTFTGWSGDCTGSGATCDVTLSAARSVTATFDAVPAPPPPPPPPPPAGTERRVSFGSVVSARRSCSGRRRLRLEGDAIPGETVLSATFTIGKRTKTRTAAIWDDPFFFGVVSRNRFTVRVVIRTADGDTVRSSRRFARCPRKKRRS